MGTDVPSSVSRTARYMALFRALETARSKERLFEDPFAIDFLLARLSMSIMLGTQKKGRLSAAQRKLV